MPGWLDKKHLKMTVEEAFTNKDELNGKIVSDANSPYTNYGELKSIVKLTYDDYYVFNFKSWPKDTSDTFNSKDLLEFKDREPGVIAVSGGKKNKRKTTKRKTTKRETIKRKKRKSRR